MKRVKVIQLAIFVVIVLTGCSTSNNSLKKIDVNLDKPVLTDNEIQQARLTPEILWKFGRIEEAVLSSDGDKVLYTVTYYQLKQDKGNSSLYIMNSDGSDVVRLTDTTGSETNPRFRPSGEKIGFISDRSGSSQLWEMKSNGSNLKQITNIDGGINSFEYSPDGSKILYTHNVKLDTAASEIYPDLPKADFFVTKTLMYRHWNKWRDYTYSHVFYASLDSTLINSGVDIMKGEKEDSPLPPYFEEGQIAWGANGKTIAYTAKKMSHDEAAVSTNSDIYIYNIGTGFTQDVTADNLGYDRFPSFSPDGKYMAWQSMKTPGYESDKDRLFLYNLQTGEKRYITRDFDQNVSNLTWNKTGDKLYFISGIRATYQLYCYDLKTGNIRQITKGVHDYRSLAVGENMLLGTRMSMSQATEIFSIDPNSGEEKQVSSVNQEIYDKLKWGKVLERDVKTTDGKEMLVWVIYPPDFDPVKKYPALLYCQGGPQSAVSQFFSYRWNFQLMAANGYIIVAPNRRGLPTFGQKWNAEISGDYGGQNMKDYLSAIDDVSKEPYVDKNRLGAVGASYGGYSVFYLAGIHQGRFKAFVAHCGMFNFESFYASTEEDWFPNHDFGGPYWANPKPKSYEFSPHLKVQNWDTPILIITGEKDYRIPYTESLQAFNAAKLRHIPAKLLIYPNEYHWIVKPQDGVVWHREFFKWLDHWLK